MKMEAAYAPETSVFTCKARMCHKPEDDLKHMSWPLWIYYRLCDGNIEVKSNVIWALVFW
jgi:hypothetical protein